MTKTTQPEAAGKAKRAKGGAESARLPPLGGMTPADITDMFATNSAAVEAVMAMNRDLGEFIGRRMRADVDALTRLTGCRDLPQVMNVQIDFMRGLAEDYFAETAKLMEQATRLMESGPIRSRGKAGNKKPKKK